MKSLYITSVERISGKTATCLAIGMHLKQEGYRVGYLKPLSLQPFRVGNQIADEDAVFVKNVLELSAEPWELSPVVLTPESLREYLRSGEQMEANLMERVRKAAQTAGQEKDVLLLEGAATMREGFVVGLPIVYVTQALDTQVLAILRFRDEVQVLDDALAIQKRLGDRLIGVLLNRVSPAAMNYVEHIAIPHLEQRGIPSFGILPQERGLAALTVADLVQVLNAEVLTQRANLQALVENLTVGAMTADAALSRFRKQTQKAVITGGDRTDIQLAALETSTSCLILTGNLRPSPLVVKQAEEFGVSVLLVRLNTMETIETIDRIFGKTRLGHPAKLKQFQELLDKHFDYQRLYEKLELKRPAEPA